MPTLRDLAKVGLKPKDLVNMQEEWEITVKFWNACLVSGDPITLDISIEEIKEIQEQLSKYFL